MISSSILSRKWNAFCNECVCRSLPSLHHQPAPNPVAQFGPRCLDPFDRQGSRIPPHWRARQNQSEFFHRIFPSDVAAGVFEERLQAAQDERSAAGSEQHPRGIHASGADVFAASFRGHRSGTKQQDGKEFKFWNISNRRSFLSIRPRLLRS